MRKKAIKTIGAFLMCLVMAAAICGCGDQSAGNTLSAWVPSNTTDEAVMNILTTDGRYAFAKYEVDESITQIEAGVDFYEGSKLVKDESEGTFDLDHEENGDSQGVVGFLAKEGKMTIGQATILGDTIATVTGIGAEGAFEEDGDSVMFAALNEEPQEITAGEKIYIGCVVNGFGDGDATAEVLEDPSLLGKNDKAWMVYLIFRDGSEGDED